MSVGNEKAAHRSLDEKRERLAKLLQHEPEIAEPLPLSFAQQRLWFLTQLEPDNPAYNIPQALSLKGPLNLSALRRAINEIVNRHEVLRTRFRLMKGKPVQVVSRSARIQVPLIDLEALSAEQRESEAQRLRSAEAQQPFDLANEYPIRASVVRMGPDDYLFLLTMHHLVSDGWSLGLFNKELSILYESFSTGRPVALPELPVQYADYAEWQSDWLQGEVLAEQLEYWKQALCNAPEVLDLPTDYPRPVVQSFRGAQHKFALSKELSQSLNTLSRNSGATLFMTLLTAFKVLLMRYTGREDIVVGTPIAGRNQMETEGLIGLFVNSLVLRTRLSGELTFREALERVKETALGAYVHQELPFERLVEELNPVRDVSHSALFQVMFILQNAPRESLKLSNLLVTRLPAASPTAKFDLTVQMSDDDGTLVCWLEYNTDLFAEKTIARMGQHFEVLLQAIAANPNSSLVDLPLLIEEERSQFDRWNQTATDYPLDRCLHELFAEQARATPDRTAVIFEGQRVTFSQLDSAANQLAHFLQRKGVAPEVRVAVCMERSLEMVIALLGVLKAGGAFVPIDPSYPTQRVSWLLENSTAPILLTEERLLASLPEFRAAPVCIDSDWQRIALESTKEPEVLIAPENAAYVIYTSGSTGKPKGSISPHLASLNRLEWMWHVFPFTKTDVCCQKTSLSFGDSIWEIFGPLLTGVTLVIIPDQAVKDPEQLIDTIAANKVTRLVLVPSLLRVILDQNERLLDRLSGVKLWTSSGEALPIELARRFRQKLPGSVLINLYGSSEVGADVTCFELTELEGLDSIPIGRPIANTAAYVLDEYLRPVPIGVYGDLYVSGPGLARGYLDHPELTAEKFLPDIQSRRPGARMFRTGDVARHHTDGTIEFAGRKDFQVKIRGYRVELGEVENQLRQHPDVSAAVVALEQLSSANQGLYGYVVLRTRPSEPARVGSELRDYLKQRLPEYMVPARFAILDALPMTHSGKIDRRALHPPATDSALGSGIRVPAHDELEERLVFIWEKLLGVRPVGVTDNFFDLGGHSLLAVTLVAKIEEEFGQRLPLVSLFQNATVASLSALLRVNVRTVTWPTLVAIQHGDGRPPLFCVSNPNVNALGYRALASYLGPGQPVFGLQAQLPEDLEGEHSRAAVDQLAGDYLKAMREVQPRGPYQFVGFCRGAQIAHEMARRLHLAGETVALLGVLDTWVLENTYNNFLFVEYYYKRLRSLLRAGVRHPFRFVKERLAPVPQQAQNQPEAGVRNPMREVYFPGDSYIPRSFAGKVTLFRVRRQPLNRIRDPELGWGKLAEGGVDVHLVAGTHSAILSEPNVRDLAEALKKHLLH